METGQQVTCGLHEGLATETGLSVSFASRRTRVIFVLGEGDEAGTLWQRHLRVIQNKEFLALGSFFLCSPFPPCVCPPPFPPVPSLLQKMRNMKGIIFIEETPFLLVRHFWHGSCF